jgi:ATP-dependent helicase/nuclease subunit A
VLVRTNDAVARMIYELRRETAGRPAIMASEEGGNPLSDSPAVSAVLSLLQLADHPGDTAAAFHVAISPIGGAVGLKDHRDRAAVDEIATQLRKRLLDEGYGAVLFDVVRRMDGVCDARNLSRLLQLVQMGYRYDAQATVRAADFVEYVRQTHVEAPTAADVRVMTVHQAKGLQFDVVVLAELDKKLMGQMPAALVDRASPVEPIRRVSRYADQMLQGWVGELAGMYTQYQRARLADSLSTIYVAMTRAVHGLYMLIAPSAENERTIPAKFSGLLRAALVGSKPLHEAGAAWSLGDAKWWEKLPVSVPAAERAPVETEVALAATKGRQRILPRRTPSQLAEERIDLAHELRLEGVAALDCGSVMHSWAQQIEWIDQGEPGDDALREAARRKLGGHAQIDEWLRQFRRYMQAKAIRDALSKGRYTGDVQLHRERSFAMRDADHVMQGAFDRVVVSTAGGKVSRVEVMDYKTDADPPKQIVERYRGQMEAYRRAAAALWKVDAGKVTVTMLMLAHGEVREV